MGGLKLKRSLEKLFSVPPIKSGFLDYGPNSDFWSKLVRIWVLGMDWVQKVWLYFLRQNISCPVPSLSIAISTRGINSSIVLVWRRNWIQYIWAKTRKNTGLAAPGALAHRLQRRTAWKSKMAARGPQNGQRGLERGLTSGYWALRTTFAK